MPTKPITVGRPSWYLDQSTLCDAIGANFMDARDDRPHYRRLLQIIERAANEGNLCIGWPHVHEFAKWNEQKAKAATQWLDGLPVVWAHQSKRVMDSEVEAVLRTVVGAVPSSPQPFAPSYLVTFDRWELHALSQGLSRTTLTHIVADARRVGKVDRWDQESMHWATKLHHDRRDNPRTETEKRRILAERAEQALRESVTAVHTLLAERDPDYAALRVGLVEAARRVVATYRTNAGTFHCTRMTDVLHEAFADKAGSLTLGSQDFRKLASGGLDIEHASVAAAYCDVFTCDRTTSLWIGDRRERLGLERQLVRGEFRSDEAFVDALETLAVSRS
jgi:hypothetical protein